MEFTFDLQMFADVIATSQLKFGAESNGLFLLNIQIKEDGSVTLNGSVQEQSTPVTYTAPTSGYNFYLPVTIASDKTTVEIHQLKAYGSELQTVHVDPEDPDSETYQTYEDTNAATAAMNAVTASIAAGTFTGGITFTSSTSEPIAINLTEVGIPVTLKNIAASSTLTLKESDMATTASLKAGEVVNAGTLTYTAAAAGAMTFVGQTHVDVDNTDPDNPVSTNSYSTVLQSGTIALQADSLIIAGEARLSGGSSAYGDDILVETTDLDGIVVKAANGKVTSITGLNGDSATQGSVTVTEYTTTTIGDEVTVTATVTTYTTLDNEDGTMIAKSVTIGTGDSETAAYTDAGSDPDAAVVTYANIKSGGEVVYNVKYVEAEPTAIGGYGSGTDTGAHTKFYFVGSDATDNGAEIDTTNSTRTTDEQFAAGAFVANAGQYYLKVSSNTKAGTPVTTTINSVELWQANAEGKLSKVSKPAFSGAVPSIDAGGVAINYTKPTSADFTVTFENADIRSKFTNLKSGDSVTTNDGTYNNLSGTYTVYNGSVVNTVTIKGKANVTVGSHAVTHITGLDKGETITFTTTTTSGTSTRTIQATAANKVTITDIAEDGYKTIYKNVIVTNLASADIYDESSFTTGIAALEPEDKTVSYDSNLTWTASGNSDGYFQIKGSGTSATAAVKAGKTSISAADAKAGKSYVHAEISSVGVLTLESVTAGVTTDSDGNVTAIILTPGATFNGTATITAPSSRAITMSNRGIATTATLVIKDLAKGSVIEAAALNAKDTVTTTKLAKYDAATANEEFVTIGGAKYYSGAANNAITIKNEKLISGTLLSSTDLTGTEGVAIGDYTIETVNGAVTVTGVNNGKTFNLGELDNLDKVTVTNGTFTETYTKYGSYLYDTGNNVMYSLGKNTSIGSSALTGTNGWKDYAASTGDVTVDLKLADTRMAADSKTDDGVAAAYDFTVNNLAESNKTTAARTAEVADEGAAEVTGANTYISKVGDVTTATTAAPNTYVAATAQTINVTNGWTVSASTTVAATAETIINGAASGKDTLIGGSGADTFNLKGAEDSVSIASYAGKDKISGYAAGKDKLTLDAATIYTLSTSKSGDVYAATTAWTSGTTDYVLLQGVGSKAVTINGADHYFGDGTKTKGTANFTYADGAYYHANSNLDNTLKVGTLKDKASKTNIVDDAIQIDLTALDTDSAAIYENIDIVDASASANVVELTAGAGVGTDNVGSTLMGGTYKSTLKGGSGNDILVGGKGDDTFDISATTGFGKDVIKDYGKSGTDTLKVSAALSATGVSVSDNDVIIGDSTGDDYVTLENAAGKALTVDYGTDTTQTVYVGLSGKDNEFKVTAVPGENDVYVGSIGGTDTIKLTEDIKTLDLGTPVTTTDTTTNTTTTAYNIDKYQGGTIDMSDVTKYASIDAVDASGVKATAATLSEFGTRFVKAHAGVNVTGSATGTAFTGSAYDDLFSASGNDKVDTVTYAVNSGNDIIDNFGVDDVIKLNNLSANDISNIETLYAAGSLGTKLANGLSFTSGGSITLKNAADIASYSLSKSNNSVTITVKEMNP